MLQGLDPQLFWRQKDTILSAPRQDLPDLIKSIVQNRSKHSRRCSDWITIPTEIAKTKGKLVIAKISDLPEPLPVLAPDSSSRLSYVIITAELSPAEDTDADKVVDDHDDSQPLQAKTLYAQLSEGKKGQLDYLQKVLPPSMTFVKSVLGAGDSLCVCCDSGKDASVGVALAALQLFFDDEGNLVGSPEAQAALSTYTSLAVIHAKQSD